MIYRVVEDATDRTAHHSADCGLSDIVQIEVGAPLVMQISLDSHFLKYALPELLKGLFAAILDDLGKGYDTFSGIYGFVDPPQRLHNCLDPSQFHDGLVA